MSVNKVPVIRVDGPESSYGSISRPGSSTSESTQFDNNNHKREMKGLFHMALSALAFSLNSMLVKMGSAYFPALQLVAARSIIQMCFGILSCLFLGIKVLGPRHLWSWLWLRGLFGSVGLALFYFSITILPLADATVLFFTGPMFTSIFASIFLGEPFGGLDFIAAFLCLVGVTLCSKPSFLIESGIPTLLELVPGSTWSRAAGSGAALTGAVLSALAYVTVRKLGRSVHFLLHVTYFGMASSIFSLTMAYSQNQLVPVRFDKGGLILVFIGLSACAGQCLLNSGLQLAPAGPGTLMRNLDVAFAFFYGITIFNEIPDFYSISGAILIVGCAVIMGLRKYFASRS